MGGQTLGEALLAPTKIYVSLVLKVLEQVAVRASPHHRRRLLCENIPRSLKKGCCARIRKGGCAHPPLFDLMKQTGSISERMFNTFNMGVGGAHRTCCWK